MNPLIKLLPFMQFSFLLKTGFLAIDLFFILFLIVALRQVFAMNAIVNDVNNSSLIKTSAVLLLILNISLFLTALVIL